MRDLLNCGQHLAFENSVCLSGASVPGFSLDDTALLTITSGEDSEHGGAVDSRQYQFFANLLVAECNWLVKRIPVEAQEPSPVRSRRAATGASPWRPSPTAP